MSLTRKLLKELELNETAIERIIAAHVDTVDVLKQERDSALTRASQAEAAVQEQDELRTLAQTRQQEADTAREELTAYRAQVEAERHTAARRAALADALEKQGANQQAIPLLLDAISLPEDAWAGSELCDETALQPWRAKYAALFAAKTPMPVTRVAPPISAGGLLTHADLKRMSAAEINRHWNAVRTALQTN